MLARVAWARVSSPTTSTAVCSSSFDPQGRAAVGPARQRSLWREQIERAHHEGTGTPAGYGFDVDNLRDASFVAEAVLALSGRDAGAFAEASRHYAAGEERHDWYGFPDLAWIALASKARRSRLKLGTEHLAGWDPRLVEAVMAGEL
jgi:hypothetical protein